MIEYIDKEKLIRDLIDDRSFYPAIVKNAIESQDVVNKWISVEDRLPTKTGKYWTYDGDEVSILRFCAKYNAAYDVNGFNKGKFTRWDGDDYVPTRKKITHWMPYFVPEPPKNGGE